MKNIVLNDILLRLYKFEDQEDFVEIFTNIELCKYMSGGAFDKIQDAKDFFNELLEKNLNKNDLLRAYGIFKNEELIGHFETITYANEVEVVYLLKKSFWGQGIIGNIITYFNDICPKTITARVLPNNLNSTKMLEKLKIERKLASKFDGRIVLKYFLKK